MRKYIKANTWIIHFEFQFMTVSAKLTIRHMHIGLSSFCGYFVRFSLRKDYRLHKKWILPHCPLSASSLCLCKPKCPSHRLSLRPVCLVSTDRAVHVPLARRDTAICKHKRLNGRQQRQHWQRVSVIVLHPAACSQRAGRVQGSREVLPGGWRAAGEELMVRQLWQEELQQSHS